eukprot:15355087-Ditylum_brightwellii.AAC.2
MVDFKKRDGSWLKCRGLSKNIKTGRGHLKQKEKKLVLKKKFSLCANYAKGYGVQFQCWTSHSHLGVLLWPVKRALGLN